MELTNTNADRRRRFNRFFLRRAITFTVVCSLPTLLNYATTPHYWWVAWVAAGWGLNLLLSLVWYLTDCDDENNYR